MGRSCGFTDSRGLRAAAASPAVQKRLSHRPGLWSCPSFYSCCAGAVLPLGCPTPVPSVTWLPLVVSLRQIQRKAAREKERDQELRRLQEEARKEEGLRLTQRLQELERDKNLLLVRSGGRGAWGWLGSRVWGGSALARWHLTLSVPGHLTAGGSPLPLQAAAAGGSSPFPGKGEVCAVQPEAGSVFSTWISSSRTLPQEDHKG